MMLRRTFAVFLGVVLVLTYVGRLSAHETKSLGSLRLTIGWGDEPAFSGFRNAIEIAITDASGAPVTDLPDPFTVEITFGGERVMLQMQPVRGRPGTLRALLVPTRPGTYAFHFTGKARGEAIDTVATCSDTTFDCVHDVSELHFPVKDPSAGQLADRMNRSLPRAELAVEQSAGARTVGIAAIVLAVLALGAAIGFGVRKGGAGH